ncbi:MAG: DUF302 domain-containing protein [Haloferacaceae archaeon]
MSYTISTTVDDDFDSVVESAIAALEDEGFGVLCDVDVQATFEKKLDVEYDRYRILGACNPSLAHQGLEEEPDLGALLPCNVTVYERDDGTVAVSAVDPAVLVAVTENPELDAIGEEVHERFQRVVDSLRE